MISNFVIDHSSLQIVLSNFVLYFDELVPTNNAVDKITLFFIAFRLEEQKTV